MGCERLRHCKRTLRHLRRTPVLVSNLLAMTLLICPCQLTAAGGDVYAASHADRARDPSLLQRFFEYDRPLTVCRLAVEACGGVERYGVDMAH